MNDTMQATGTGANNTYMFPITMEEVTARMNAYKATPPEAGGREWKGWRAEASRRDAWYDVTEAKIRLALRKMAGGADIAGESAGDSGPQMEVEPETLCACRRLGMIFDDMAHAAEERDTQVGTARSSTLPMEELEEKATSLDRRIAELSARNVKVLHGKIISLGNELRFLGEVMLHGQWKRKPKEERPQWLASELALVETKGYYTGPKTEEAARARLEEIERELETLNETKRKALTDGEAGELAMAQRKRGGIAAAIMNAMPEFEKNAAIERAALEKFEARFEAAMIDAASVVEVYRIDCERLALG